MRVHASDARLGDGAADLRARDRVVVLHPALDARYHALVASIAPTVEARLDGRVAANRTVAAGASAVSRRVELRPWRLERRRYLEQVRRLVASVPAILATDVRHCYASISPDAVARTLLTIGIDADLTAEIVAVLRRLERGGIEGLPIGPEPSAVLATAVLSVVDAELVLAGFDHPRWVDDLVVALPSARDAAAAIGVVDAALAGVGLRRHVGKTRVLAPPRVAHLEVSPTVRRPDDRTAFAEARGHLG
jgi:hypothetical protein